MKSFKDIRIILLLCLTLGLAPFSPEPHLWGKLKWIAGGAKGMGPLDWLDTMLHGFPWVLLIIWLSTNLFPKKASQSK
ncbi:MAG: hypothetical protein AAFY45_03070 [Bacteroidota bacterium]